MKATRIITILKWLSGAAFLALLFYLKKFFRLYSDQLFTLSWQHLRLILLAMSVAIPLGIGLGMAGHRFRPAGALFTASAGIAVTIPSIALFGAMIPLLAPFHAGVGTIPAVIALVIYSQLPIIRNTIAGLDQVPKAVVRAARGMGMTPLDIVVKIKLPLAFPVILTGIRIAVVMSVGVAAVAAYIGAGGLGRWIFGGIRQTYPEMMLGGATAVSLMALGLDYSLKFIGKLATRGVPEIPPDSFQTPTREKA